MPGTAVRAPAKLTLITVPAAGSDSPNRWDIGLSSGPYAASIAPISTKEPRAAGKATRVKEVSSGSVKCGAQDGAQVARG